MKSLYKTLCSDSVSITLSYGRTYLLTLLKSVSIKEKPTFYPHTNIFSLFKNITICFGNYNYSKPRRINLILRLSLIL